MNKKRKSNEKKRIQESKRLERKRNIKEKKNRMLCKSYLTGKRTPYFHRVAYLTIINVNLFCCLFLTLDRNSKMLQC